MKTHDGVRQLSRASIISVMLTAIAISVNHVYTLGAGTLLLGATLLVLPAVLFTWFKKTGSTPAFIGYLLMNAWMVLGFGLKGLWTNALPVFVGTSLASVSTAYPRPAIGAFGFEMSGLVMFLGS